MRLFAAVALGSIARRAIAESQSILRAATDVPLRWVLPEQLHVTLKFFGDVETPRAEGVVAALSAPVSQPPFDVTLGGLGAFPPRGAPRALWMGVRGGAAPLLALQREIDQRARRLGFEAEDGGFHPHLTIARSKRSRPSDRSALLAHPAFDRDVVQRVDCVVLYESVLSSGPPRYVELARANLTGI
jgi:2'-5' RNA ligase